MADASGNQPIAMVNLIAQRRLVPELLQQNFTAANVAQALAPLLADTPEREAQIAGLAEVRTLLNPAIATEPPQTSVISTEPPQTSVISTEAPPSPVISTEAQRSGEIAAFPPAGTGQNPAQTSIAHLAAAVLEALCKSEPVKSSSKVSDGPN